ncbi:thioesterase [Jannaschia pagri]|uniref:Thioesterase n=1 Tax=Jannaschia pagri TaxID=2829797 RepID=A0ABQ4NIG5_9RHOB|nr:MULTISPECIES: PaaI family thioesterase [unclassified Jannaschia]GIT89683.1 thioesterase [Jannaschia sp. AI_61]GIT94209.1 thioesterase [Jannaschia sp. AI_62]
MPETTPAFASRDTVLGQSGLAFMEGIRDGRLPPPPISRVLNYRVTDVSEGRVVFVGTPLPDHCNPLGTVHGGWYGTLLDSAMSCAVHTTVPQGQVYTTLEYKVNVTRSIPVGLEVAVEGLVQHAGRTTGVANGWIRGVADGKTYATGSATCLIMAG